MIKWIKRFPQFLKEVREELKKVNWATRKELMSVAIVVIIVSTVFTVYIAGIDLGLSRLLQFLLK